MTIAAADEALRKSREPDSGANHMVGGSEAFQVSFSLHFEAKPSSQSA